MKMIVTTTPEMLVEELEKLPAGDRGAETLSGEATPAIASKRAAAAAKLFNQDVVPASADLIALYRFHTERWKPSRHADGLIELHGRALGAVPLLAALLRSPEAMGDMEAAAGSTGMPSSFTETHQEAQDAAAVRARARVESAIARQLVAAGGDLATDARDLVDADDLAVRAAAACQRHELAAQAAAAQVAAAARSAQDAADAAADASAAETMLSEWLFSRGLPRDLRTGPVVAEQRERMLLQARAKRRLLATRAEAVRVYIASGLAGGRGLYATRSLAGSLEGCSVAELHSIIEALDVVEGSAQPS